MNLNNIFKKIYNSVENNKNKYFEFFALILYIIGISCIAFFHEPWFDEFQALQISKSSVHDILFVIPHMEGHPPLWHLILKFTSIFTNNPELCIKIPNIIFSALGIWILIFKSPFPRIVRLSLPFTYFIFYQYGVISRPYSILMFALFLVAYLYQKKNENPFAFGLSLGLLCFSSCYGIIIAFAITLAWLTEIWNKQKISVFIKSFLTDKRFYTMLFEFLICLFIFFEIYPTANDVASPHFHNCPIYQRILYDLFGMISDATLFNIATPYNLNNNTLIDSIAIIGMICGIYITYLLFKYFSKNNFLLFSLTYGIWLLFISLVYFYNHHIGILTLILIFNFWCSYYKNGKIKTPDFNKYLKVFVILTIIMQIYWSISAAYLEIKHDYSYGKSVAIYLKNNNIAYNYKIFCPWGHIHRKCFDKNEKEIKHIGDIVEKNKTIEKMTGQHIFNNQPFAIEINTYFPENIFFNFNVFYPERTFTMHADTDDITQEKVFNEWKKYGTPDIVFESSNFITFNILRMKWPELKKVKYPWEIAYNGKVDLFYDYMVIKTFPSGHIWKANYYKGELNMYIKKSLYNETKDWK